MRLSRKDSPPTSSNTPAGKDTPKPNDQSGTSSPVPRTRIFFVLDSVPDEAATSRPPASPEETYRDALEDAVDTLLREVQATSPSVDQEPVDQPVDDPVGPVAQGFFDAAGPSPEQSTQPDPVPPADAANADAGTDSTALSQPNAGRQDRREADSPTTNEPPRADDARRTSPRIRVRRELLWNDEGFGS